MKKNRWQRRPPNSNWGEFGPDDQRGRMNWVTREKVLRGVAEVKEGITFVLSRALDYPGGNALNARRHPPRIAATQRDGRQNFCYAVGQENPLHTDVICDDLVLLTLQYSTQWDSFAHVGGMFDADVGGKRHAVVFDDLKIIIEMDKVEIERGDIVCLHTGFAEMLLELKKNPTPELLHNSCTGLDGRDEKLLKWITDSGLSVLAPDK